MKARIVTKIPERVLLFALDKTEWYFTEAGYSISYSYKSRAWARCRLPSRISWISREANV